MVIACACQNLLSPVKLLPQKDARQLVRKGHEPEGNSVRSRLQDVFRKAIGSADAKTGNFRRIEKTLQKIGKSARSEVFAFFVKADENVVPMHLLIQARAFRLFARERSEFRIRVFDEQLFYLQAVE